MNNVDQMYMNEFGKRPPKKGDRFIYNDEPELGVLTFDEIAHDEGASFFMLDFLDENGEGHRFDGFAISVGDLSPDNVIFSLDDITGLMIENAEEIFVSGEELFEWSNAFSAIFTKHYFKK